MIIGSADQRISDHRISGSADQRIIGSADQRISGSSDQRISGSADHRIIGSSDQRIIGSADQRDHRISGSSDQRIIGSADQRIAADRSGSQRIIGSSDQRMWRTTTSPACGPPEIQGLPGPKRKHEESGLTVSCDALMSAQTSQTKAIEVNRALDEEFRAKRRP